MAELRGSLQDELFLDLKKGRNEVTIAVSEDFGGWGVEARLDDLNGLVSE